MNKGVILGLIVFALICTVACFADSNTQFMGRTTIVDFSGTDADYHKFFTTVSANIFTNNGISYRSLVMPKSDVKAAKNILEDWKKFAGSKSTDISISTQMSSAEISQRFFARAEFAVCIREGESLEDLVMAANAASYAAMHNVPLITYSDISELTSTAKRMSIPAVILVGSSADENAIARGGIKIADRADNLAAIVKRITTESKDAVCCAVISKEQLIPAVIAACSYKGYVVALPDDVVKGVTTFADDSSSSSGSYNNDTGYDYGYDSGYNPYNPLDPFNPYPHLPPMRWAYLTNTPVSRDYNDMLFRREKLDTVVSIPISRGAYEVSAAFFNFLGAVNGLNDRKLEKVLTFATKEEMYVSFERSITGDPSKPALTGAVAGRLPGDYIENSATILRGVLYKAVVFSNKRPAHVTMSMVAYEVHNDGPCTYKEFTDNESASHKVNEFYGYYKNGKTEPGVFETFSKRGYEVAFRDGTKKGTGSDPVFKKTNIGFVEDINNGSTFFYNSSHGSTDSFHPQGTDDGVVDELEYGADYWPSKDGRVNSYGSSFSYSDFDKYFTNMSSTVMIFNSCLVGGGRMNREILENGGAGVVSSYISVSFTGSGWYWCLFVDKMTSDMTLGEANAYALARTSEIFPTNTSGKDSSLRYVYFGDPMVEYIKPDWKKPSVTDGKAAGQRL